MNRVVVRWFLAACLLAAVMLLPSRLRADDFLRVSPGPLNQSHASLDDSSGCASCHVSGKGVTNQRCLGCHSNLLQKGGLHPSFGKKPCISCHTEHKGRDYAIIDWSTVGGRDTFNHDRVGFSLKNDHAQVACGKCHVRRLASGRLSYLGLSTDCQSCHGGIHQLSRPELAQKCEQCHPPGKTAKGMRLSAWLGPHARYSGTVLSGKHEALACTRCHPKGAMPGRSPPRSCVSCHTPNHPTTARVADCASCHPQSGDFASARVDHKKYGFPLVGKHQTASCGSCHPKGRGGGRVRGCADCHRPAHPVVKATANCTACHVSGGTWKSTRPFDHSPFGLPLLGSHKVLSCELCHNTKNRKLDYREGSCASCHTHRNAHDRQFDDKPCASCHDEGGQRKTDFDHQKEGRFPLTGAHAEPKLMRDCQRCHPKNIYRTGKLSCADCHEDPHQGTAGKDCARCHSPLAPFDVPVRKGFKHEKFPLEGRHAEANCAACHVDSNYKLGPKSCVDCHQKDDVHKGRLGRDCGRCHTPGPGAPKFDHQRMTRFGLTGAHRRTTCASCHSGASAPRTVAAWKPVRTARVDRSFSVVGSSCEACHTDPHRGSLGRDCARCHSTERFSKISRSGARRTRPLDHAAGWARFHGTRADDERTADSLSCASCHGKPACQACHRTRKPRSHTALFASKTHGREASFDPSSCRTCHQQASCTACHRRTAPMNHRGSWPTRHGFAAGGFGDTNCMVCHRRADCAACHRAQ